MCIFISNEQRWACDWKNHIAQIKAFPIYTYLALYIQRTYIYL